MSVVKTITRSKQLQVRARLAFERAAHDPEQDALASKLCREIGQLDQVIISTIDGTMEAAREKIAAARMLREQDPDRAWEMVESAEAELRRAQQVADAADSRPTIPLAFRGHVMMQASLHAMEVV